MFTLRSAVVAVVALPLLALTPADAAPSATGVHVSFQRVVSGLSDPVSVTSARDGSHRLFVVQQGGTVVVVKSGRELARPYLAISNEVVSGGEQGLLSLAFHPHFAKHPFVYAAYTRSRDGALVVARFHATSAPASTISASTERHLLTVPHPQETNHNGGQLMFGKDGFLYISTGDGGGGGDPFANAEDLNSLSGKVLRINVDHSCGKRNFCVPKSNPFAKSSTRKRSIFDWGLRNPWRMSVDRATGRLWIGDVGQDAWEEIDHVKAVGGKDFGWSCREGRTSYNSSRCTIDGQSRHITGPVHVYPHSSVNGTTRCAVIGGYAYHGPKYRFAHGFYLYGDYCTGEIWARNPSGHNTKVGDIGSGLTGFGESDRGEIYAVTQNGSLDHAVWKRS